MRDVIIDGVRYVPATEAAAGLKELRDALILEFWGNCDQGKFDNDAGLFVRVYDDGDGTSLGEFIAGIAARLTTQPSR